MWLKINGGCDEVILKAASLLVFGGSSWLGPELELPVFDLSMWPGQSLGDEYLKSQEIEAVRLRPGPRYQSTILPFSVHQTEYSPTLKGRGNRSFTYQSVRNLGPGRNFGGTGKERLAGESLRKLGDFELWNHWGRNWISFVLV